MKYILLYLLFLACMLLVSWESVEYGKHLFLTEQRQAYTLCMSSHVDTTGDQEQACKYAQDNTSTEFICNNTGHYCWLEVK